MIKCTNLVVLMTALAAAGCRSTMPGASGDMSAEAVRAKLDRLEMFVGRWSIEGEAKMAGIDEPIHFTGTSDVTWEGDRSYVVARGVTDMGGTTHHGLAAITYDPVHRVYRDALVNSAGGVSLATARYDESERTWHMKATSEGPEGSMSWTGTVTYLEADSKREHWVGSKFGGLIKKVEITKTERRLAP